MLVRWRMGQVLRQHQRAGKPHENLQLLLAERLERNDTGDCGCAVGDAAAATETRNWRQAWVGGCGGHCGWRCDRWLALRSRCPSVTLSRRPAGWLAGWLAGRLAGWVGGWLAGCV